MNQQEKINQILNLVREVVDEQQASQNWQAGKDFVNYSGPFFDSAEYVSGVESLLKGWLVMGGKCKRFENLFPTFFGKDYGILTNSGSSSNLLMMASLTSKRGYNLQPGTKVLIPVAGFPTTLNPTLQLGFKPVFVDIEIDTLNLDLDQVEATLAADPEIRVITFAHVLGNPPDMNRVLDLVNKYNLIFLEDCCDALGSTYDGKPLGSFGEMASCSFYPAHHITMGEGGFVACKTKEQEVILTSFREWGRGCYCVGPQANKLKNGTCGCRFSEWLPSLPGEIFDHKYVYNEIGYNLKPIEIQGAWGVEQIKKIPEITQLRRRNYQLYMNIYEKYEEYFHIPRAQPLSEPSWFSFPLTVRTTAPFRRTDIVEFLEDRLIQTRPYFAGNTMLQPAYTHLPEAADAKNLFPVATHVTLNTFFHGTSPVITPEQIAYIGDCVDEFMRKYGA